MDVLLRPAYLKISYFQHVTSCESLLRKLLWHGGGGGRQDRQDGPTHEHKYSESNVMLHPCSENTVTGFLPRAYEYLCGLSVLCVCVFLGFHFGFACLLDCLFACLFWKERKKIM